MATTVIGGGYAGVMAANRLAGHDEPVALVTATPWFVERIRLHAVASGAREHARQDFDAILHPDVELVIDTATRIEAGHVQLASGRRRPYDTLVYAVGSAASPASGWHSIVSEEAVEALRAQLRSRPQAPVTVVGAGLTGIELAGALHAAGRRVRLLSASAPARRATRSQLDDLRRRGVEVQLGRRVVPATGPAAPSGTVPRSKTETQPVEAEPHGERIEADEAEAWSGTAAATTNDAPREEIVVDATGLHFPSLAEDSGLATDPAGRLIVDAGLRVPGHPRIYGAGDAALPSGVLAAHLRPACATAMPMGAYAADAILARRRGGAPAQEFGVGYVLQCVDLGGGRGHVQFVHPDDRERPAAVTGRAGGLLKEAVCRLTVRWLAQEREHPGRYSWPAPPRPADPAVSPSPAAQ